ncbi:hypothetical protein PHYBLDRAFT_143278 [Phycomyces blakesleeanus NRRL 1555(-)]|uniref:Uncharacterized protein n=1 Tax=Phycomyces blakesleeanus (strain ATCC 8743b / DSM 1359 / FGSC 10004 / NBRC 33097 / NRRL 1555) TaxID=763407 RepID=A0A167NMS0_PHYB8|nr:hypothetical protein PHYBLDRAFT_143278 [Phycomyces blakesleeanus NRRL 1555(-)]OAD76298.1 hypothetical protein PHYBLDRAFT_143278 [Phycomyces blakesleeanus NRRL 1555(-)]|eukprot:XP_018294338.1 hypothetical protein PHYBLDRAFT_143278 [Phycomyces blakesleeanus NRRL 1555(-)]
MGKSAKFYRRPTKKEKEGLALKKVADPAASVAKRTTPTKKKTLVEAAMDIDVPVKKTTTNPTKPEEKEKPDYVDLLSGKKTYKKKAKQSKMK